MKKLHFILSTMIFLLTLPFSKSHAQVAMNNARASSEYMAMGLPEITKGETFEVNQKAQKNFQKDYQLASGAQWSVLSNKTLMCRFFIDSELYKAYYSTHGNWMYTISSYDGDKLDKSIADRIKTVYYNSSITYVNQFDLVNAHSFYIVEIQDAKSIKKVRVNDDEIEVVQEIEKI